MSFLKSVITRFQEYKRLAEKALAQISDEALLKKASSENDNSLVVIIKHMQGNMLSRWTNFLTEDGEKAWRRRDHEFVHEDLDRDGLMRLWEEGWTCLFGALNALTEEDLVRTIYIRQEAMSAMDAIIRQVMHYSYHIGQIILLCKLEVGDGWKSLSIPKGASAAYNAAMMSKSESAKA